MTKRPAAVTQAEIARAIRAAASAGAGWRVEIEPGGLIRIERGPARPAPELAKPKREAIF